MKETTTTDTSRFWAGLEILERLSEAGTILTSKEVGAILGTLSVKGIGSALRSTKYSLAKAGIRLDEAVRTRSVRGTTVWSAGPRIRQARYVLEHERLTWTAGKQRENVPLDKPRPGYPGPVLVLRALKVRVQPSRIDGPIAELDAILESEWFKIEDRGYCSLGEVFIDRIESGDDEQKYPVPEGYGENGIWIRGTYDYANPRVSGAIGTGRYPTMVACIGEATWIERRVMLVDAVRQVERVRAETWLGGSLTERPEGQWQDVDVEKCFRYVSWLGTDVIKGKRSAPPLRMRLRCWYDIVIETAARKRFVLREEGLRGDDARTVARAIECWRKTHANHEKELVSVREVRIAKFQPRPMPA